MVSAMSRVGFGDVRCFASLDSTNRYLLDEARAGAPEGVVAVADFQTAGRGRLGRKWEAPPGQCLLTSILLRPRLEAPQYYLCSVAVALAAQEACQSVAGVEASLKWPNDLVVNDRKLAGILAESDPGAEVSEGPAVVVGIGVNVGWAGPPEVGGTSLLDEGAERVDRFELLDALLDRLALRRPWLDEAEGRERLVGEFEGRCGTIGRTVRVECASEIIEGVASALTASGHLVVETAGGPREVSVGDVVHLRPS
jgi:BirA family biotin operon repressor/biotin-[acetyl-CoA-carboxylase] ligase